MNLGIQKQSSALDEPFQQAVFLRAAENITDDYIGTTNPFTGRTFNTQGDFEAASKFYAGTFWTEEEYEQFLTGLVEGTVTLDQYQELVELIKQKFSIDDAVIPPWTIEEIYSQKRLPPDEFVKEYLFNNYTITFPSEEYVLEKVELIIRFVELSLQGEEPDVLEAKIKELRDYIQTFVSMFSGQMLTLKEVTKKLFRAINKDDHEFETQADLERQLNNWRFPTFLQIAMSNIDYQPATSFILQIIADYVWDYL